MANANKPRGLQPVKYLGGADWDGRGNVYYIPTSDTTYSYHVGDPVTHLGSADANGIPGIVKATAGSGLLGSILAIGTNPNGPWVNPNDLSKVYVGKTRTVAYYALVADDPNIIFEVQEVSGGTQLTAAEVGLNANLDITTEQTTGFVSDTEVGNSAEAGTSTLDVKLLGLVQRTGNAFGAYAKWLVLINNHVYRAGITGV
jgi:hypothetical protein